MYRVDKGGLGVICGSSCSGCDSSTVLEIFGGADGCFLLRPGGGLSKRKGCGESVRVRKEPGIVSMIAEVPRKTIGGECTF